MGRRRWAMAGLGLLLAVVGAICLASSAQAAPWASPGTGIFYEIWTLSPATSEVSNSSSGGNCEYRVHDHVTISSGDTLRIAPGCVITFDPGDWLSIEGRLFVNGTASNRVTFRPTSGSTTAGQYPGLSFDAPGFARSYVDNLSINYATYALRCDGCRGLSIHNLSALSNTGDLVQIIGGGSDVIVEDVTMNVASYASQSVVAMSGAANITGRNVTALLAAVALLVWNASNVTFLGPISAAIAQLATVWVDNATSVNISGVSARNASDGVRVTNSQRVTLRGLSFNATANPVSALNTSFFTVDGLTVVNATATALVLSNVSDATAANLSVTLSGAGLNITRSARISLFNVSATATGSALSVTSTSLLVARNLTLSATAGAVVQLSNVSDAQLFTVSATGGRGSFLVSSSSNIRIEGFSSTSSLAQGILLNQSNTVTLKDGRISAAFLSGLDVRATLGASATNLAVLAGLADGITVSGASTASFDNVTSSFNTLHGLTATSSVVNGSWLALDNNGRDGLRLSATTSWIFHLEAADNGANGTTAVGSSLLFLEEGVFENNTGLGLYSPAGPFAIFWAVTGLFNSIANNRADFSGNIDGLGGRLVLLNAAVRVGSSPGFRFTFDFADGATLWLDNASLDRSTGTSSYTVYVHDGSSLVALHSTIANAGSSALEPALELDQSTALFDGVVVEGPLWPIRLSGSVARLDNTTINGPMQEGLLALAGSDVAAFNLSVRGAAGPHAIHIDGASTLDVDFLNVSAASLAGVRASNGATASGRFWQVDANGSCALCVSSLASAVISYSTFTVTGAGAAVSGSSVAALQLNGIIFVSPLGESIRVAGGDRVTVSQSSATGALSGFNLSGLVHVGLAQIKVDATGPAVMIAAADNATVLSANLTSTSGPALSLVGPGWVWIADSAIEGSSLGASVAVVEPLYLFNSSFKSGDNSTALRLVNVGALGAYGVTLAVGRNSTGAMLSGVTGLIDGMDVGVGDFSTGLYASGSPLGLSRLGVRLSGPGTGVELAFSDGMSGTNLDVQCGPLCTGLTADQSYSLTLDLVNVEGGAVGLRVNGSGDFDLSRGTLANQTTAGIWLSDSWGALIAELDIEGTSVGVKMTGNTTLRAQDITVDNATDAAVEAQGGAWGQVFLSSLSGAPGARGARSSGSLIQLFDTTHENSTFEAAGGGVIEVLWSLTIHVVSGVAPVGGVAVRLTNATGQSATNLSSDAAGNAAVGWALEFVQHDARRDYASPYHANATLPSGVFGLSSFDLDRPRVVELTLIDNLPPVLAARVQVLKTVGSRFDFGPVTGDGDNVAIAGYLWNFTNETGVPLSFASTTGSYTFAKPGHYLFTVTAFDASGNRNLTTFDVWVNAPPAFTLLPTGTQLEGLVGQSMAFTLEASDPDPEHAGLLVFNVSGAPGMVLSGAAFSWTPVQSGATTITVSVSDGRDQASATLTLFVSSPGDPSNRLPVFTTDPPLEANLNRPYEYDLEVVDPDAGDTVILQLINGTAGMTLQQFSLSSQAVLSWMPSAYFQRGADAFTVLINVSLRAWDTHGFSYQNFTIRLRNPPDVAPEILNFTVRELAPGDVVIIDLRQFMNDSDDALSDLRWSIRKGSETAGTVITFDTEDPYTVVIRAPTDFAGRRSFFITFVLTDPSGLNDTMTTEVVLVAPSLWDTILPWLLLIIIIGGAGAAYAILTRQGGALPSTASPSSPTSGPASTTTQPAAAAAAEAGFPFLMEGAAVLGADGGILAKDSIPDATLGETFDALPGAWRAVASASGGPAVFKVGDKDAAGVKARDGAVIVVGRFAVDPTAWVGEPLQESVTRLESHGADLAEAAGQPLVHEILRELLGLSAGATAASVAAYSSAEELRVASVVEMVGGMVRLKVAVDNNTRSLAADVRLSLDYDDKVLRLERSEPTYETKREKIMLGNIRPKERKTVAFYFDPQICTRSLINATVAYDDAAGRFRSAAMKTRPVEVVCPAFSTPRKASTAMLKRLLREELAFRDSKYFRFPAETPAPQVFEGCKQAVMAQDLQLVREFVNERPFEAEAWFYGETKATKSPMVVWTTVYGHERVTQFSVASSSSAAITGLLAELGRRLVEGRAGGGVGAPIQSFARSRAEQELGDRASLLSKSESGELESKDH